MGNCGGGAAFGLQMLIDADARFFRPSLPVWYVEANYDATGQDFSEMGRIWTPMSSSGQQQAGNIQTLIDPPVSVRSLTLKQLSDANNMGSHLRMGAKSFTFSNTWVQKTAKLRNYTDLKQVFSATKVLGFLYDNILHDFDSFIHQDAYGAILTWEILCNAPEERTI